MWVQRSNFGRDNVFTFQIHEEKYNFHLHIHQYVELTLVLDGELRISVDGGEDEIAKAGDFILIFPFQSHKYSSDKVNKFVIYTFSPSLISDFFLLTAGRVGRNAVFHADNATTELFKSKIIKGNDLNYYSIRACLYAMLGDFTKRVELRNRSNDSGILQNLVTYINEHYKEPLTLEEVAKAVGYSKSYLSHCIKSSFSFGFPTLLACIRCEAAKTLILETTKTSLEISEECGFGCERSFNRQFGAITGMSPGKYKKTSKMTVINKAFFPQGEQHGLAFAAKPR